jgi:hypothetical protein
MRMFSYRQLGRLLLIFSVCLLTIAQATHAFSPANLLKLHAVANLPHRFARHAVEEVGSRPVADAGASTPSSTVDAKEPKQDRLDPVILDDIEAGLDWSCEHQFHRRILPQSNDDDN